MTDTDPLRQQRRQRRTDTRGDAATGRHVERGEPVHCSFCRAQIAVRREHGLHPAPPQLAAAGAVPIRRVGWFCSRRCVGAYQLRFRVILEPEALGVFDAQGECSGSGSN